MTDGNTRQKWRAVSAGKVLDNSCGKPEPEATTIL